MSFSFFFFYYKSYDIFQIAKYDHCTQTYQVKSYARFSPSFDNPECKYQIGGGGEGGAIRSRVVTA